MAVDHGNNLEKMMKAEGRVGGDVSNGKDKIAKGVSARF